jgi:YaiO family outer membrane protein
MKRLCLAASVLAPLSLAAAPAAHAQDAHSVQLRAETQDFSDDLGSLRSATLEYKAVLGETTILVSPTVGERRVGGLSETAVGGGATVYHDWSDRVSTRTEAFVAEEEPVFANLDFAQDVTVQVADKTTVTLGGRWARYFGDREVTFLSLGARRYFKGGSVAYRLSRVDPEGRGPFLSHLVNLSINDGRGAGKTQLWLAAGAASLERSQLEDNFQGEDYSALLQRTQPLTTKVALVASAGLSSYDRPGDRITATNFGLGLLVGLD